MLKLEGKSSVFIRIVNRNGICDPIIFDLGIIFTIPNSGFSEKIGSKSKIDMKQSDFPISDLINMSKIFQYFSIIYEIYQIFQNIYIYKIQY